MSAFSYLDNCVIYVPYLVDHFILNAYKTTQS